MRTCLEDKLALSKELHHGTKRDASCPCIFSSLKSTLAIVHVIHVNYRLLFSPIWLEVTFLMIGLMNEKEKPKV